MADAFAAAIDTLFAGPLAVDASYAAGGDAARTVRLILRQPDLVTDFGQARLARESVTADARASEVARPRPGDVVQIAGANYVVQGEPLRDALRLIWTLDLRPQ